MRHQKKIGSQSKNALRPFFIAGPGVVIIYLYVFLAGFYFCFFKAQILCNLNRKVAGDGRMLIKTNRNDGTQIASNFHRPPDPLDLWKPQVAIIGTRTPIRFQQEPLFPNEGKGFLGRIHARFLIGFLKMLIKKPKFPVAWGRAIRD